MCSPLVSVLRALVLLECSGYFILCHNITEMVSFLQLVDDAVQVLTSIQSCFLFTSGMQSLLDMYSMLYRLDSDTLTMFGK